MNKMLVAMAITLALITLSCGATASFVVSGDKHIVLQQNAPLAGIMKYFLVNVFDLHYLIVVAGMFIGGLLLPLLICWFVDRVPLLNKKAIRLIIGY